MIETLTHRDMSSRLVSFLMVLCRDFEVAGEKGITIDFKAFTSGNCWSYWLYKSNHYKIIGDLKDSGLLNIERKKITVFDPIALAKRFNWFIINYDVLSICKKCGLDFNCFLILLGGLIAPFGDILGTKIGKARLSILKLRPKKQQQ